MQGSASASKTNGEGFVTGELPDIEMLVKMLRGSGEFCDGWSGAVGQELWSLDLVETRGLSGSQPLLSL